MPKIRERVAAVRAMRLKRRGPGTRTLGDAPTRFHVTVVPDKPFLVIPESSSERREYLWRMDDHERRDLMAENALLRGPLYLTARALKDYHDAPHFEIDDEDDVPGM